MLVNETCRVHDTEVGKIDILVTKLETLITDVKWVKKFGSWWMGATGAFMLLFIPLVITFVVYVHSLDKRLSITEQTIKDHAINNIK